MPRDIELRDIPTILGASKTPSPWELWNLLAGTIPEKDRIPSTAWWRKHLRAAVLSGIEDRYAAAFTPLPAVAPPNSLVPISGVLSISKPGNLPLSPDAPARIALLRQITADALAYKWTANAETRPPIDELARAHIAMMAYGVPKIAVIVFVAGGADEKLCEVAYDRAFAQDVIDRVSAFRRSVAEGNEPAPDYTIDLKALESRWKPTDPEPLDLTNRDDAAQVISDYRTAKQAKSDADARARHLDVALKTEKARLKEILGNHKSAIVAPGLTITCSEINIPAKESAAYSYQRFDVSDAAEARRA